MHDKPITAAIYLVVGLIISFLPILVQFRRASTGERADGSADTTEVWDKNAVWRWAGGSVLGVIVGTTLFWWRTQKPAGVPLAEILVCAAIISACLFGLFHEVRNARAVISARAKWCAAVVAGLVALVLCFTTGILSSLDVRNGTWLNWGAYIGPAELLRAGARIFYDFPAQYGLGPSAVIAVACGDNCWIGMYFVSGSAALAFATLGILLARSLRIKTFVGLAVIVAAVAVCFLLWTAYPPTVLSPLVFPSTNGMRFLPPLTLLAALWWSEGETTLKAHWTKIGFTLFAVGALWSPESLFMSFVIWGPYYCLRRLADAPFDKRFRVLLHSVATLAAFVIALFALVVGVYQAKFGVFPSLNAYLAFILYPPGPMPINPYGSIWFIVVALALGAWSARELYLKSGNSSEFRRLLLLMSLSYASLSYAMGRSHDNNFLNILPCAALIISCVIVSGVNRFARSIGAGMLASLLGLMGFFGWSFWKETIAVGSLSEFKPREFFASLNFENAELLRAIAQIRSESNDPIMVIDQALLLTPTVSSAVTWNTINVPSNYVYMPPAWRREFLRRGADRLNRGGWLIYEKSVSTKWNIDFLADFQSTYKTVKDVDFGSYRAVLLMPHN